MMSADDMGRRTKVEIGRDLVAFLTKQERPFYKQQLIDTMKMNSKTADEWLELYAVIQAGPKIKKIDLPNNVAFEIERDN